MQRGGYVLETASASLLMYFRVRKSTKLEFGFHHGPTLVSARMPTEFLFQLGGLSAKLPRTSGAVI